MVDKYPDNGEDRKTVKSWYKNKKLSNLGSFSGRELFFIVQQPLRVLLFYTTAQSVLSLPWAKGQPLSVSMDSTLLTGPLTVLALASPNATISCSTPAFDSFTTESLERMVLSLYSLSLWFLLLEVLLADFCSYLDPASRVTSSESLALLQWVEWPCHVVCPWRPVFPVSRPWSKSSSHLLP